MQSEFRFIEPAEPPLDGEGELVLDPSLLRLAGQLRTEADLLAQQYPSERIASPPIYPESIGAPGAVVAPEVTDAVSGTSRHWTQRAVRFSLAAASLLSAAGSLCYVLSTGSESSAPTNKIASSPPTAYSPTAYSPVASGSAVAENGGSAAPQDQPGSDSPEQGAIGPLPLRVVPVGLTPTYSGPQWEGVLDLMEAEQADEPSVSI